MRSKCVGEEKNKCKWKKKQKQSKTGTKGSFQWTLECHLSKDSCTDGSSGCAILDSHWWQSWFVNGNVCILLFTTILFLNLHSWKQVLHYFSGLRCTSEIDISFSIILIRELRLSVGQVTKNCFHYNFNKLSEFFSCQEKIFARREFARCIIFWLCRICRWVFSSFFAAVWRL